MKNNKDKVLERWMKEFFPYGEFREAGIFTKEMRGDYKAQAACICGMLGLESIYEYGKDEIRCHITYVNPDCPMGMDTNGRPMRINHFGQLREEPFVSVIPSIWDEQQEYIPNDPIDGSKYDEDDEEPGDGDAESPLLVKPPGVKL